MQINYFKESVLYDCAANEILNMVYKLRQKQNKEADALRENGKEPSRFYDIVISDLMKLRQSYMAQADILFKRHKELVPDLDVEGINNLMCAMAKSWAEDYEKALCTKDDYREQRLDKLRDEARYIVTDSIVNRIERAYKKFKEIARGRFYEILEDTEKAKQYGREHHCSASYVGENMRNRCPCCGGGMYAKKLNSNVYRIQCPSCSLFEIVEVIS